jgi:hypothetical protein
MAADGELATSTHTFNSTYRAACLPLFVKLHTLDKQHLFIVPSTSREAVAQGSKIDPKIAKQSVDPQ